MGAPSLSSLCDGSFNILLYYFICLNSELNYPDLFVSLKG